MPTPAGPQLLPDSLRRIGLASVLAREHVDGPEAAARLERVAQVHGLDLGALFGFREGDSGVGHAALGIPGRGRTANVYVSSPRLNPFTSQPGASTIEDQRRAQCIDAVCAQLRTLRTPSGPEVCIAQTLLEPSDLSTRRVFEAAGFECVGRLRYLHQPITRAGPAPTSWPDGIRLVRVADAGEPSRWQPDLLRAMERSYEQTLDCPRMCGMRATQDVLDSHLATGQWDAALWWIVYAAHEPHGCMLLSRCPEQDTVELVYLGISPQIRGQGIATRLLRLARASLHASDGATWSCAVDEANAPALALYERIGFVPYALRDALVRSLHAPDAAPNAP